MSPDQINAWADAAIHAEGLANLYGPGLLLASCLITAWRAGRWIYRLAIRIYRRVCEHRALRRTPAATDNLPPQDDDALAACRRIAREPLADPDASRTAYRYLRDTGEETP